VNSPAPTLLRVEGTGPDSTAGRRVIEKKKKKRGSTYGKKPMFFLNETQKTDLYLGKSKTE